jgi:glyoxylate/hydroxypyruvate reductase A
VSIVLIGDLSAREYEIWHAALRAHLPPREELVLARQCTDKSAVDVALAANPPRGELAQYPNLRFIQSLWAGVDRLLSDPALPDSVPIARLVDPAMSQAMLESVVAATLFVHRQFPAYLRQQQQSRWHPLSQKIAPHCKVGILGYGAMGRPAADALAGLGFRVSAWGQHARADVAVDYSWGATGLARALTDTWILINLLPLTSSTVGILNTRLFAQLPQGASIINLGRGAHLNEEDLLAALQTQRLAHAVLDVFRQEPLAADHPFWTHPQITVLPHVAATTDPESAAPIAARNIAAFRAGRQLTGVVSRGLGY